jgi:hypothetical protein
MEALGIPKEQQVPESRMMKYLLQDGVYTDDHTLIAKYKSAQIQRLEERLVRERASTLQPDRRNR